MCEVSRGHVQKLATVTADVLVDDRVRTPGEILEQFAQGKCDFASSTLRTTEQTTHFEAPSLRVLISVSRSTAVIVVFSSSWPRVAAIRWPASPAFGGKSREQSTQRVSGHARNVREITDAVNVAKDPVAPVRLPFFLIQQVRLWCLPLGARDEERPQHVGHFERSTSCRRLAARNPQKIAEKVLDDAQHRHERESSAIQRVPVLVSAPCSDATARSLRSTCS